MGQTGQFIFAFLLFHIISFPVFAENNIRPSTDCNGSNYDESEWIDIAHQYINESLCEPAAWFDSFFATDRVDEEVRPGSRVRWTNDFIQAEGADLEYVTKVRASVRLPRASERLKLVFEGEDEDTLEEVVPTNQEEVKTDIGFLYEFLESARSNLSMKLNLSPRFSLRYRFATPVFDIFTLRFTEEYFHADGDYGTITRLDLEKKLSEPLLFRVTANVEDTYLIDGNKWTVAAVLFHKLSNISALSYESSVTGFTIPETYNANARVAIRYRRNFYRRWLFYELVPEITWPRELITDERTQVAAFTFRLEINFINM